MEERPVRRPLVAVLFAVGVLVTGCSGSEQSEAERKSFEWGHDVAAHAVLPWAPAPAMQTQPPSRATPLESGH